MNAATIAKLERLLKKFPETWNHTKETQMIEGQPKVFHHVDYRSGVEGKPRVRLVSHVSSEMCEMLVTLKNSGQELIASAKGAGKTPAKKSGAELIVVVKGAGKTPAKRSAGAASRTAVSGRRGA